MCILVYTIYKETFSVLQRHVRFIVLFSICCCLVLGRHRQCYHFCCCQLRLQVVLQCDSNWLSRQVHRKVQVTVWYNWKGNGRGSSREWQNHLLSRWQGGRIIYRNNLITNLHLLPNRYVLIRLDCTRRFSFRNHRSIFSWNGRRRRWLFFR